MSVLTYPEAIGVGLLQGVAELFPVSSLGHSILIPALLGGHWKHDLDVSADGSLYLNELVGLHLATALALVVFFWRDWVRVIRGLTTSITQRRIETVEQRLAWLIITASIPVAVAGLTLDKLFRTTLGRPVPTAIFLALNGIVLFVTEKLRRGGSGLRRAGASATPGQEHLAPEEMSDQRITGMSIRQAMAIGAARSPPSSPGSAAPVPRSVRASSAASTTRTPHGSRSCSPRR